MLKSNPVPPEESGLPTTFITNIRERVSFLEPRGAWIFGSSVNKGFSGNDIDVFIVSKKFRGIRYPVRATMVDWPKGPQVDTWLYTFEEFENIFVEGNPIRASLERQRIDLTKETDQ